jgi:hypothetical protein
VLARTKARVLLLSVGLLFGGCGDDGGSTGQIRYHLSAGSFIRFLDPYSGRPIGPPEDLEGEFRISVIEPGARFVFDIEELRFRSTSYSIRGAEGRIAYVTGDGGGEFATFETTVNISGSDVTLEGWGKFEFLDQSSPYFYDVGVVGDGYLLMIFAAPQE